MRQRSRLIGMGATLLALASPADAQQSPGIRSPQNGSLAPTREMQLAYVQVNCALQPDRSVSNCRILYEQPVGSGRIAIERKLGPEFRLPNGVAATADGRVTLEVPLVLIPPAR